jgi:hypothetical protein
MAFAAMSALFRALESTQQGGMNNLSMNPPAAENSSGAASLADSAAAQSECKSLTYPKPRNFAEVSGFVFAC